MKIPQKLLEKEWHTDEGNVTSDHLVAMLDAIKSGRSRGSVFGCGDSDRRVDRSTQLLRKAGLIKFEGKPRRCVVVEQGRR